MYGIAIPGGTFRVTTDVHEWGAWFETAHGSLFTDGGRVVAKTLVGSGEVSTMFLGIEHPIGNWFETMTFDGLPEFQRRYKTYQEAVQGHAEAVAVFAGYGALVTDPPKLAVPLSSVQRDWLLAVLDAVPTRDGEYVLAQCETLDALRALIQHNTVPDAV